MGLFRIGVSIFLLAVYVGVFLTSIVGTALPIATFGSDNTLSLWQNCTQGSGNCTGIIYYCTQSQNRFNTGRAFGILTIFCSFFCIACTLAALVHLIWFKSMESGASALRGTIHFGLAALICIIIALAMAVVIQMEPLCDGFAKLQDASNWAVGGGAVAYGVCSAFAMVGACFGRMMESRISTSELGV